MIERFTAMPGGETAICLFGLALSILLGATLALIWERRRIAPEISKLTERIKSEELHTIALSPSNQPSSGVIGELSELSSTVNDLLRLHGILTTNLAASVMILDSERNILFCSPFTTVLTGYSPEELIATPHLFLDIVEEEDRERLIRAWSVSCLGEEIHVRYRIRHRSSLVLWLETRFVPIIDENDPVNSVLGVTIDLTDTMDRQRQIEEKNRDLEDFTYMVSHDLKAPIFTIKGMASVIEEDFGKDLGTTGLEYLRYIVEASDRLEKMIASVLAYSRLATQPPKDAEVSLSDTIEHVRRDLAQQLKDSSGEISVGELPSVWGDPVRVYQIFANLLGNALKYRHPERAPRIAIRVLPSVGSFCTIEVSDNGGGIPHEKLSDIFRPYHRAHGAEVEGSGIGLACVKKIVDAMGGAVTARSSVGQGSTFSVVLPLPRSERRTGHAVAEVEHSFRELQG